jgi:hypothetical protein
LVDDALQLAYKFLVCIDVLISGLELSAQLSFLPVPFGVLASEHLILRLLSLKPEQVLPGSLFKLLNNLLRVFFLLLTFGRRSHWRIGQVGKGHLHGRVGLLFETRDLGEQLLVLLYVRVLH